MKNKFLLKKNKIILGSANFSLNYGLANKFTKINIIELNKILRECEKININFIDTSKGYGKSEKIIGNLKKKKWNVITKIPLIKLLKKDEIETHIFNLISDSLNKLKIKKLYGLLMHDENQLLLKNSNLIYDTLIKLKKKNLVKKIGVSFYSAKKLKKTINKYKIDLIQIPLNYINREFSKNNLMHEVKSKNIEIHARSIFLQGLLLKNNINYKKFDKFIKYLNNWHKIHKLTNLETSLNYINSLKYVDKYILGFDSVKQIHEIFKIKEKKINYFPFYNDKFVKDPRKWNQKKLFKFI